MTKKYEGKKRVAGKNAAESASTERVGGAVSLAMASATPKTPKLFLNGVFTRSESGRTVAVTLVDESVVEVAVASRKDIRDAVRAGGSAADRWAATGPYLRGQILYRLGEMLAARSEEFDALAAACGLEQTASEAVDMAIGCAGWCDKLGLVLGSAPDIPGHSVATAVRPLGLSVTWLSSDKSLVDLVGAIATALAGGNATLVLAEGAVGLLATSLAEVVATADVPVGVVQLATVTGLEAVATAAGATEVQALDVVGHTQRAVLETAAAQSLTRCRSDRRRVSVEAGDTLAGIRWQVGYTTTWAPTGR